MKKLLFVPDSLQETMYLLEYRLHCLDYSCVSGGSRETAISVRLSITSTFSRQLARLIFLRRAVQRGTWCLPPLTHTSESQPIDHTASPGGRIWASCLVSTLSLSVDS